MGFGAKSAECFIDGRPSNFFAAVARFLSREETAISGVRESIPADFERALSAGSIRTPITSCCHG